jgi:hypothetical protein
VEECKHQRKKAAASCMESSTRTKKAGCIRGAPHRNSKQSAPGEEYAQIVQ